jgi:putative membrane protein insertion efficiency factor
MGVWVYEKLRDFEPIMSKILKKVLILPIRFYQGAISPHLGQRCRFQPTCSHYMIQAIEEWGPIKGLWLGLKRIGKCHPWGPHGHDPVPKKEK